MKRLCEIFEGWGGYQTSLVHAIEPRTPEELAWKPSENLRSAGEITRHIALGRVNWFLRVNAPKSDELAARIPAWESDPHGNQYIVEKAMPIDHDPRALIEWLNTTWEMID